MSKFREITQLSQWHETVEKSKKQSVVILKHSTRCPVSTNALEQFEKYIEKANRDDLDFVMVKVIESRPVSNQIAEDLSIAHASPQLFWIKDGKSQWNTSHWSITQEHLRAVLD